MSEQPKTYYHRDTIEAINVIKAWLPDHGYGFCLGNVIKYCSRAGVKTDSPIPDLEKAISYLKYAIEIKQEEAQSQPQPPSQSVSLHPSQTQSSSQPVSPHSSQTSSSTSTEPSTSAGSSSFEWDLD